MENNEMHFGKITNEESEQFNEIKAGLKSLDDMFNNLVDRRTQLHIFRENFWQKIYQNYSLDPSINYFIDQHGFIHMVKEN